VTSARWLTTGHDSGHTPRRYSKGNIDGPWPRLRAVIKAGQGGKPISLGELGELIEAAGKTPPSRVGRAESTTYALALALRERLTKES
jgi:hypothetical protein